MRLVTFLLISLLLFFSSCDESNPSGNNNVSIIGTWILATEKETEIEIGVDTTVYIDNYTVAQSYIILVISATTITMYTNDEVETNMEVTNYTMIGNKITLMGESFDVAIVGGQLYLKSVYTETGYIDIWEVYFNKYTGAIPPESWPDIPVIQIPTSTTTIQTNGSSLSGTLDIGKVNWYIFSGIAGKAYVITTTGDCDTYLRLYKTAGSVLELINSNDDMNEDELNSQITWICSANGTYYFSVRGYDDDETGSYGISVLSSLEHYAGTSLFSKRNEIKARKLKSKR